LLVDAGAALGVDSQAGRRVIETQTLAPHGRGPDDSEARSVMDSQEAGENRESGAKRNADRDDTEGAAGAKGR
jgi:hypothetical protein